jgi:osmotically-inducible protein OsmY
VTLTGEVDWHHERQAAEEAARSVPGVKEIYNQIALRATPASPEKIKEGIERALGRSALVDASLIQVRVEESRVILTGTVRSPAARAEAEATAWRAPGVTEVVNQLQIEAR